MDAQPMKVGYSGGYDQELTNVIVVGSFLSSLKDQQDHHRPVDIMDYRSKVVDDLTSRGIPVREEEGLDFIIDSGEQDVLDLANRGIILARKILVTARDKDVPTATADGAEAGPQDYLDGILSGLGPVKNEHLIGIQDKISDYMTRDANRNVFPAVALEALPALRGAYDREMSRLNDELGTQPKNLTGDARLEWDQRRASYEQATRNLTNTYRVAVNDLLHYANKILSEENRQYRPLDDASKDVVRGEMREKAEEIGGRFGQTVDSSPK